VEISISTAGKLLVEDQTREFQEAENSPEVVATAPAVDVEIDLETLHLHIESHTQMNRGEEVQS
jgi:hypothetical protein